MQYNKCRFYCLDTVEDLTPYTGTTTALHTSSVADKPGYKNYKGQSYDMTREGLYRFSGVYNGQLFFYNKLIIPGILGDTGTCDVYKLLSSISWNHVHGTLDANNTNYQVICNQGANRMWSSQCGDIVGFCIWMVSNLTSLSARLVSVETLETFNNGDDGHKVLEVYINGKWRMFDMTLGRYYVDGNGDHMSTAEFIAQIANNGSFPTVKNLSSHDKSNSQTNGGIDLHMYLEMVLKTEAEKEAWCRRIFQSA